MALVPKLKRSFLNAVTECRALYNHSLAPRAFQAHIRMGAESLGKCTRGGSLLNRNVAVVFITGRLRQMPDVSAKISSRW